jgi:hypothetical protein
LRPAQGARRCCAPSSVSTARSRPFLRRSSRIPPEAEDPEAGSVRDDNEKGDEDGEILLWVGTEPGELLDPEAAIALVAPYALIPDDLAARLREDMDAAAGKRDGAHQIEVKRILFGSQH